MADPPELSEEVKIPQKRNLPSQVHHFSGDFYIDFLLLTVVDCEFLSCFSYLQEPLLYQINESIFVYIGKMGVETEQEKLTIGLMKCNMGSGVGGSAMAVKNAADVLKPKGVFCVGFCGGMNDKKAKLGDVVVSAKLISYAYNKFTEGRIQYRGTIVPMNKKLNNIMTYAGNGWNPPLKNIGEAGNVVEGTMLSGPQLVNGKTERERLLEQFPQAIAIEMEGEGVYTAAHDLEIEWAVVKGISDYADGTKDSTKDWKPYASLMAASLVAHVLRQPSIFKDWPRYHGGSPAPRSAGPPKNPRIGSSPGSVPSRDNQVAFKEGKPNDKELDELAGKIGAVWETLGIRLGISDNVVSGIAANDKDKPYKMLVRWRNITTSGKPYGELHDALCHERVGLNSLAKEFCCKGTT